MVSSLCEEQLAIGITLFLINGTYSITFWSAFISILVRRLLFDTKFSFQGKHRMVWFESMSFILVSSKLRSKTTGFIED